MSRTRAIAIAIAGCFFASSALAQPTPSAGVTASAPTTAGASATAAPGASASSGGAPSASGALPPGHPPTGDLPPGHPPTGDLPPGHPPAGAGTSGAGRPSPHAGGGGGRREMFEAPEDTAEDDPTLPAGTIVLSLRDANEQPIAGTEVSLGILHNTVATGESREKRSAKTDAEGNVRWESMAFGSGTSYRASVTRGRAQFGTMPFALGDRTGKRVVLHVYGVTNALEEAAVGTQGLVYLALREDSIVLEHLYTIWNIGAVAWVPENQTIELPEGYKAFNRPDSMDGVGVDEVNGRGELRGTIGPGRHDVSFRYQVPLDENEKQTVRIELPPNVAMMRVMVESSKTMGVEVAGFPASRKTKNRDGKRVLVTDKRFSRDDGENRAIQLTLTGLPTPGPGRWIALVIGACAVAGGLAYANSRRGLSGPDEETRRDLVDAREAILRDLVELERRHRAGEIGPKTYQRLRGGLLDALERLVSKIQESSPAKAKPAGKHADAV